MHKKITGYKDIKMLKLCYYESSNTPYSFKASESMFEYSTMIKNSYAVFF